MCNLSIVQVWYVRHGSPRRCLHSGGLVEASQDEYKWNGWQSSGQIQMWLVACNNYQNWHGIGIVSTELCPSWFKVFTCVNFAIVGEGTWWLPGKHIISWRNIFCPKQLFDSNQRLYLCFQIKQANCGHGTVTQLDMFVRWVQFFGLTSFSRRFMSGFLFIKVYVEKCNWSPSKYFFNNSTDLSKTARFPPCWFSMAPSSAWNWNTGGGLRHE